MQSQHPSGAQHGAATNNTIYEKECEGESYPTVEKREDEDQKQRKMKNEKKEKKRRVSWQEIYHNVREKFSGMR